MNSKILFLCVTLFTLLVLTGCGVKADPIKYPETAIDSYMQSYTGNEPTPEELERTKRDKEATEAAKKSDTDKVPSLIPSP